MAPLGQARERASARYVVLAHGHWVEGPHDEHRSWLIRAEDIEATGADYLALGHWDRAVQVGGGRVPAYYSGSPDVAKGINVVRFGRSCAVEVSRRPLPDLVREDDVHGAQS
jgi:DNA repair exonuclease SbcCD nuclease subunit